MLKNLKMFLLVPVVVADTVAYKFIGEISELQKNDEYNKDNFVKLCKEMCIILALQFTLLEIGWVRRQVVYARLFSQLSGNGISKQVAYNTVKLFKDGVRQAEPQMASFKIPSGS